jgi:hypothetical protein
VLISLSFIHSIEAGRTTKTFFATSLMYTGSASNRLVNSSDPLHSQLASLPPIPEQCIENQISAILPLVTSSSFLCLVLGLAPLQASVLLLRNLAMVGLSGTSLARSASPDVAAKLRALRSVDDLEWPS